MRTFLASLLLAMLALGAPPARGNIFHLYQKAEEALGAFQEEVDKVPGTPYLERVHRAQMVEWRYQTVQSYLSGLALYGVNSYPIQMAVQKAYHEAITFLTLPSTEQKLQSDLTKRLQELFAAAEQISQANTDFSLRPELAKKLRELYGNIEEMAGRFRKTPLCDKKWALHLDSVAVEYGNWMRDLEGEHAAFAETEPAPEEPSANIDPLSDALQTLGLKQLPASEAKIYEAAFAVLVPVTAAEKSGASLPHRSEKARRKIFAAAEVLVRTLLPDCSQNLEAQGSEQPLL